MASSTAKPSVAVFLNNPCHNCRRRRLRCDRSRPVCNKCSTSGRECLGYDKLFVWTHCAGGTSRRDSAPSAPLPSPSPTPTLGPRTPRRRLSWEPTSPPGVQTPTLFSPVASPVYGFGARSRAPSICPSEPNSTVEREVKKEVQVKTEMKTDVKVEMTGPVCMPSRLTDPLLNDLDLVSRRYLAHFTNRLCKDLAAHDGPVNPFRDLIPLALHHPFLLHIIIASSAVHLSNISHPRRIAALSLSQSPSSPSSSPSSLSQFDPRAYLQSVRAVEGSSTRRAFLDALVAKQRAYILLRAVLESPHDTDGGALLAAVLFFVNFELIDLGRSGWKTHLHAACRILDLLTRENSPAKFKTRTVLIDCIVSDFVIYHILGSTLTAAGLGASIARHAKPLFPIMERVQANSYLCCPLPILHTLLLASQLSGGDQSASPDTISSALNLLRNALAFDIPSWALSMQDQCTRRDLDSRTAVASAHRGAVCLYILQAIPSTREDAPVSAEALVDEILEHLGNVGEGDEHFKATSWPTFIAGAEARDGKVREWVLRRLLGLWECCPWGYVFAAMEMLRRTWRVRDEGAANEVKWLQELWAKDLGFLIV